VAIGLADGQATGKIVHVKSLEPPDTHYLRAAQGWLELGSLVEANEELERLSPEARLHPDVLEIRWQVYAGAKKWGACVGVGLALMKAAPDRAEGWLHHSFALHALKRTQEAYTHLATVADKFDGIWTVPYNLSCYCSQLGRFEEAQEWFKRAAVLNDMAVQKAGVDDPDLKPLWDSMSTNI